MSKMLMLSAMVALASCAWAAEGRPIAPGDGDDEVAARIDDVAVNVRADRRWHKPDWTVAVTPYAWAPALDGSIGIDGFEADISASIGDGIKNVVDNFEIVAMLRLEARCRRWMLILDGLAIMTGNDEHFEVLGVPGSLEWDSDTVIASGLAGYRFADVPLGCGPCFRPSLALDALAGARIYYMRTSIDVEAGPSLDDGHFWADPVVGARAILQITPLLSLNVMANIGGFDVGSDLAWQLVAGMSYEIVNCFALHAGWMILDIDYEHGDFAYDVNMSGPYLAATFRF